MPVLVKVTQNKNDKSPAYGKWYGRVVSTKTMSYQELCKHMSEHNSVYGEDVCLGVANKLQNCMLEQLLEGKKVQFGELGTFYLSVKSTGTNKEGDYNLGVNIQGLYLCFAPSRTDVNNLSSKMLKKKATFLNIKDMLVSKAKTTNGSLTPDPSPTGEGSENQSGGGSSSGNGTTDSTNSGNSGSQEQQQTTLAKPVIGGDAYFQESTQVTITGPEGAQIYYSESGDDPDTTDTLYTQPFTISEDTTVKAIAVKDGQTSEVTVKNFTKGSDDSGGFETAG